MASLHTLSREWSTLKDAREFLAPLFRPPPLSSRQTFGLLQRPQMPRKQDVDTYSFKVFVTGRTASGKSATIAKLTGHDLPESYVETLGLQASIGYWPAYVTAEKEVVLFRISFFDAGDTICRKFDHIQSAGLENASVVLVLFALTDRPSFEDAQKRLQSRTDVACILIGTHADLVGQHQVTEKEASDVASAHGCAFLPIANTRDRIEDDQQKTLSEVSPILNQICDIVMQQGSSS